MSRELYSPQKIEINLADVAIDREISITGTSFYVYDAPDQNSYVSIKINHKGSDSIDYYLATGFRIPFEKLWISTPTGQGGAIRIVVLTESIGESGFIDNRSSSSQVMTDILSELKGPLVASNPGQRILVPGGSAAEPVLIMAANAYRHGGIIRAAKSNSHDIAIGYDDGLSADQHAFILAPGEPWTFDKLRFDIYALGLAPDIVVTGNGMVSAEESPNGDYNDSGVLSPDGENKRYTRTDSEFHIWVPESGVGWVISKIIALNACLWTTDYGIFGTYYNNVSLSATGNPLVADPRLSQFISLGEW